MIIYVVKENDTVDLIAKSLYAKLELVKEYDLRGVGYWQIMRFFRAMWLIQVNI